jgi:hypothetical protein
VAKGDSLGKTPLPNARLGESSIAMVEKIKA